MIEKTGIIGGLDLPEKAEHTRERETERERQTEMQLNSIFGIFLQRLIQLTTMLVYMCRMKKNSTIITTYPNEYIKIYVKKKNT